MDRGQLLESHSCQMSSRVTGLEQQAIEILDNWYNNLELYQNELPSKGSIAAALVVLKRLQDNFSLDVAAHVAGGEAQITGQSATSVKKILAEFNETRLLSSVGGRSNRGARGAVASLLNSIRPLNLIAETDERRKEILKAMQRRIVHEYVPRFFAAKRVKAAFDRGAATWQFISALLVNAKQSGKGGPVAEHLVGAKLALKFPQHEIRNKPSSSADVQSGFAGDFEIGNTTFHVTLAPMPLLFEKIKENLAAGYRVYLLVDQAQTAGAKQQAELHVGGRIAVESIESFVATNIDELAEFDGSLLVSGLNRLLTKYNERVNDVEFDKSLLIDIPPNLE